MSAPKHDERRHYMPRSDRLESWPRKREYAWMAIAAMLALELLVVGPLDFQAAGVTAKIVEEEGARRAPASAGDPRELPQRKLSHPLACLPPQGEWILHLRDGRMPGSTRETSPKCVNAKQKVPYVP